MQQKALSDPWVRRDGAARRCSGWKWTPGVGSLLTLANLCHSQTLASLGGCRASEQLGAVCTLC